MKIQIDGTSTDNKGAELMLYAVLEQIEKKYPEATVYFNDKTPDIRPHGIETSIRFIKPLRLILGHYPWAALRKLKLPYLRFTGFYPEKKIDLVLDASGFRLGDQWNRSDEFLKNMEYYYHTLKTQGTRIVLLPQAFGPFETENAKMSAQIIGRYADLIFAREAYSEKHLSEAIGKSDNIFRFPDFTNAVEGIFPDDLENLKGGIAIIPNEKMITHTGLAPENYLKKLKLMISELDKLGKEFFLLNHGGKHDLDICKILNRQLEKRIPIINNRPARQLKGIIGTSFLVISSRFHGIASALNQGVPCLATSWSHKYRLLYDDYQLGDYIIDPEEEANITRQKIAALLDPEQYKETRNHLLVQSEIQKEQTETMWQHVWKILKEHNITHSI